MRRRLAGLDALVALVVVATGLAIGLLGCAPTAGGPEPPPTEAEARAHLDAIVALARNGDFEGLCGLGSGVCRKMLEQAGRDAVPIGPPLVVGTRLVQPVDHGDTWSSGGMVLEVCGIDGRGDPYYGDVFVIRDQGRLISTGTVYWARMFLAEGNTTGQEPREPPAACPG